MNSNQSAFPQHGWSSDPETVARMQSAQGLTKREYFAAMAMQGMLSDHARYGSCKEFSIWAVQHADALLAALEKEAAK